MHSLKQHVPWPIKIGAKLVLSRLPVPYDWWKRIGLFRHGSMADPAYARGVFQHHLRQAGLVSARGIIGLELGPGDSLFSALLASASGFEHLYLVDEGPYAERDLEPYLALSRLLEEAGPGAPAVAHALSLEDVLDSTSASYLTNGLASLRSLPSASVDFAWSHAVLEHIKQEDFLPTMGELRRVLHDNGVCSHRIDLRDHFGGGLNNLRFPSRLWESKLVSSAGFYTNRIRYSEMLELFRRAAFAPEVIVVDRWDTLPTGRERLAQPFRALDKENLSVLGFDVLLRPV